MSNNAILRGITAIIIVTFFWVTFFYCSPHLFSITLGTILGIILTTEWKNIFKVSDPLFWIIMPLYPITPFFLLMYVNESPDYRILLLYLFIIVSVFDTASYIFGTVWGKHKIIPSISPGKTWEGALGGYLTTTIVCFMITFHHTISWHATCLLSLIICTLAFAGDIFESYLKRSADIKDSGNLLPGHGGFLDRFDAIMFVSFFFFAYKDYLITVFIA